MTAWDVERLVLGAFPQVWKAKCFPALDLDGRPSPGVMTVAVVPAAPDDAAAHPGQAAMFDVLTLRRIEAFLDERSSAFARVRVRNPSYERLQLRAKVGFASLGDDGTLLRRLKLDVSRFLGVWTATAPMDGFGWSLNLNDVAAYLSGLDYVRFMTDLSILHLVSDDGGAFRLYDTPRGRATRACPGASAGASRCRCRTTGSPRPPSPRPRRRARPASAGSASARPWSSTGWSEHEQAGPAHAEEVLPQRARCRPRSTTPT